MFEVKYSNAEELLGTTENDSITSARNGNDYKVRIFDADFNELTINFEADIDRGIRYYR